MRSVGRSTLVAAALFLAVVAVLINSQQLFFMSTAMIVTLAAARIQSYLAIQGLRVERVVPPAVAVGDTVTVQMTLTSERRIRRPLISIVDSLPGRMAASDITPSLPVAPAPDQPVETRYSFRPRRRGSYRWNRATIRGTDALGLIVLERTITTEPCQLKVYPAPIPVSIAIAAGAGMGNSELETGRIRGSGLDTRGIREYATGDPLKHVHWASSARTGRLMVKEFETGAGAHFVFLLQRTKGSDVGEGLHSTLEAMCGHALYLAEQFLRKQAIVQFGQFETDSHSTADLETRLAQISDILTVIVADSATSMSEDLRTAQSAMPEGATVILLLSRQDTDLPSTIARLGGAQVACLVYDAAQYAEQGRLERDGNASNPSYLARLQDVGAQVMVMPEVRPQ
ncbi:MAG: hypothetical protein HONBIEJF_02987 [Fimbriimonadaceae bacterium]|nr:hypothetical protein [Fimbriimonadaceae bacterium]